MIQLTSKQRKQLEKLAHDLEPVVIVGGNGVTPQVVEMIKNCLNSHELIKVKFNEYKDEKLELSQGIQAETDSTLIRVIGNVAIFFRQNDEEDKRKIKIK